MTINCKEDRLVHAAGSRCGDGTAGGRCPARTTVQADNGPFASNDVTIADPAVGTGTFLPGRLTEIADRVAADKGAGAVRAAIEAAAKATNRVRVAVRTVRRGTIATDRRDASADADADRYRTRKTRTQLFITDTLGNPSSKTRCSSKPVPLRNRAATLTLSEGQPITVVIGNPPQGKGQRQGRLDREQDERRQAE